MSWSVHDSIQAEKLGIPTVTIATDKFAPLGRLEARVLGQRELPIVVIPHPIVDLNDQVARALGHELATEVAQALRGKVSSGPPAEELPVPSIEQPDGFTGTADELEEMFYSKGWSDGLPIVLPTEDRVTGMLVYSPFPAGTVIGKVPPLWAPCTVEKIAVNAVMAGCRPEYFPVVVAATSAILQEEFNLYGVQGTTNPASPLVLVNGPISRELGFNSGGNCFGQGFRANATVGRAVRLIMTNVGGGVPASVDKCTVGHPGKYSYCVAENELASPWEPLHVERGYRREDSTVTVFAVAGPHDVNDKSTTAEGLISTLVQAMLPVGSNSVFFGSEAFLALCPQHAVLLAREGISKSELRQRIYAQARLPLDCLSQGNREGVMRWRPRCIKEHNETKMIKLVEQPDLINVIVAGGPGNHSLFAPFWRSRSVTRRLELKDGTPARSITDFISAKGTSGGSDS